MTSVFNQQSVVIPSDTLIFKTVRVNKISKDKKLPVFNLALLHLRTIGDGIMVLEDCNNNLCNRDFKLRAPAAVVQSASLFVWRNRMMMNTGRYHKGVWHDSRYEYTLSRMTYYNRQEDIAGKYELYSDADRTFEYKIGECVKPRNGFNSDKVVCGSGIHGFLSEYSALTYLMEII